MVDNIGQYTIRLLLHPMTMSCLKLPYQFEVLPVFSQWLRSLRLKTARSSLTVWQFCMKRAKEANIIGRKISLDAGFRVQKNGLISQKRGFGKTGPHF